jgi:hypothetical protein
MFPQVCKGDKIGVKGHILIYSNFLLFGVEELATSED